MARFVRNKYSFSLSDDKAARLTIQNLKRYATKLGKEKAKTYAERMEWEGMKKANELLAARPPQEMIYFVGHRPRYPSGRIKSDIRSKGNKLYKLPTGVGVDTFVRVENGRTRTFVRLVGPEATFYEFGTGVTRNDSEHPYKKESGLSPLGTYGAGQGANKDGWFIPAEVAAQYGVIDPTSGEQLTKLKSLGIKQGKVLYDTAQHLKTLSPSIAKQAFKGL